MNDRTVKKEIIQNGKYNKLCVNEENAINNIIGVNKLNIHVKPYSIISISSLIIRDVRVVC
jgi:hypothetical protein